MTATMTNIDSALEPLVALAEKLSTEQTVRCELVSHTDPHEDEAAAARLLLTYAAKTYIGISIDGITFWGKRTLPEDKTAEQLIAEGRIGLGVWGLDEHARDGKEAKKGHACLSMTHALFKKLIEKGFVRLDEQTMKAFEAESWLVDLITQVDSEGPPAADGGYHLENVRAAYLRSGKDKSLEVMRWLIDGLTAMHGARMARDVGKKLEDKNLLFAGTRVDLVRELAAFWVLFRHDKRFLPNMKGEVSRAVWTVLHADNFKRFREQRAFTDWYDTGKHGACPATFAAKQFRLTRDSEVEAVLRFLDHVPATALHGRRIMEDLALMGDIDKLIEWSVYFFDALASRAESRKEATRDVRDWQVTKSFVFMTKEANYVGKIISTDNQDVCGQAFRHGADLVAVRNSKGGISVIQFGDAIMARQDRDKLFKEIITHLRLAEFSKTKTAPKSFKGFDADDCLGAEGEPQRLWSMYRGQGDTPKVWIFNQSKPEMLPTKLSDSELLDAINMAFQSRLL